MEIQLFLDLLSAGSISGSRKSVNDAERPGRPISPLSPISPECKNMKNKYTTKH